MKAQQSSSDRTTYPTAETVSSGRPNVFPDRTLSGGDEPARKPADDRIRRDLISAAPCDGTGVTGSVKEKTRQ